MATAKEYAYFLKGNRVAIVEKDTSFDTDVNSKDYGPGANVAQWKSPLTTVADGIEIEYTYAPSYYIQTTNDVDQNITQYQSTDGYLSIADNTSAYINYATTYALAADKYIVLRKAGRFNGLHKIKALSNNSGTNNKITLYTKYSGSEAAWTTFEETPNLYYAVDVMNSDTAEDFTLPVTDYQANAMVYFVKAKIAEDRQDYEQYEYLMSKFKKMLEQNENAKVWGSRMLYSGPNAIR